MNVVNLLGGHGLSETSLNFPSFWQTSTKNGQRSYVTPSLPQTGGRGFNGSGAKQGVGKHFTEKKCVALQ